MSWKERARVGVMQQVEKDELQLIEASEVLGLSYRQAKRIWARYELHGERVWCTRPGASRASEASRPS